MIIIEVYLFVGLLLLSSCVNTKRATYFENIGDTTFRSLGVNRDLVIQANNILHITVTSLNSDASAIFNRSVSANNQGSGGNNTSGYLVDPDGNIQFPVLGNVKAEGLTKLQLKEKMTASLKDQKLLFDPIVTVRLGNYKVTVLGEVKNPNVIYVPSEKITILEAIGFAGDLTLSAKRDKVVLIREEQGNKTIRRLNLTNNDIFNSPYYYLKSDDVLYVEATKAKIAGTTGARTWLPIVFSAVSMTALVFSRLIR